MKHIFLFIAVFILFNCKPEKEEPKPLTAPVLTTMEAGDITAISALSGGAISSDGGSPVTARGIVWSVSHNPTLSDSVSEEGTGIGSFTSDLTPLKYSTTYYVRAYATNSIGTTYGNEVTFNTKAAVPSDGLVGWWPFNGNANDESGNGNDGVNSNALSVTDRFNESNRAFQFNGTNSFIRISTLDDLQYTPITYSAWVVTYNYIPDGIYPIGGGNVILGRDYSGYPDQGALMMYQHPSLIDNNFLWYRGQDGVVSQFKPELNKWYHVLITIDNGIYSFFINGSLVYTEQSVTTEFNNLPFLIGAGTNGARFFWDGLIDDIAIYNRALTAEEIQKIYNGTGF